MTKIYITSLLIRLLLEGFILLLLSYTISNISIEKKKFILNYIFITILAFFLKVLPLNQLIIIFLNLIMCIISLVTISKFEINKAIKSILISFIFLLISEAINAFLITKVLNLNMNEIFNDPLTKTLYGLPSLVIYALLTLLTYLILYRKRLQ